MENQDWSQLGNEVKHIVESAVESQDFKELNHAIEKTVSTALNQVGKSVNQAGKTIQDSIQRTRSAADSQEARERQQQNWEQTHREQQERYQSYSAKAARPKSSGGSSSAVSAMNKELYHYGSATSGMSSAMIAIGFVFLVPFAIIELRILKGILFENALGFLVLFFIVGVPTAFFGWLGGCGLSINNRLQRFKKYVNCLGDREFCNIEELQAAVGKRRKFVIYDLMKMIRSKMFRQGHLDKQGTCLMVTDQVYRQYVAAQQEMERRQQEQRQSERSFAKKQREQEQKTKGKQKEIWKNPALSEEAKAVIREGIQYLEQIKRSNDAIPGEEISRKSSRLEMITDKIFQRVEQHPELIDDLRRFMDYYLPTTVKLLKAYEEMDAQPVQGPNIMNSKKEIEDTLDTINQAFENLLDSFFEDVAWDISSDITVLHTMLAQEGLTDSEFSQTEKSNQQ